MPSTVKGHGRMTALAISPEYLLANFRAPSVIRSEAQNEHYIEVLEQLERKKKLTKEEQRLAELLTLLITDYEEKHFRLKPASPVQVLQELMRANGLRQK